MRRCARDAMSPCGRATQSRRSDGGDARQSAVAGHRHRQENRHHIVARRCAQSRRHPRRRPRAIAARARRPDRAVAGRRHARDLLRQGHRARHAEIHDARSLPKPRRARSRRSSPDRASRTMWRADCRPRSRSRRRTKPSRPISRRRSARRPSGPITRPTCAASRSAARRRTCWRSRPASCRDAAWAPARRRRWSRAALPSWCASDANSARGRKR